MLRSKVLNQAKNHNLIQRSNFTVQTARFRVNSNEPLFLQILINNVKIQVEVDTGAGATLMPVSTF